MWVSIRDVLAKTKISYWQFVRYRREDLLPGPVRVEKLKGKGSISFYPDWIIGRIQDIQRLRKTGRTLRQVKEATNWKVEERLSAIIRRELETEEGQRVDLSEFQYLPPAQVFKEITRTVAAGYSGHLVKEYRVRVKEEGTRYQWIITMDMSKVDLGGISRTEKTKEGKRKYVH